MFVHANLSDFEGGFARKRSAFKLAVAHKFLLEFYVAGYGSRQANVLVIRDFDV
jgi:hypothetical protein